MPSIGPFSLGNIGGGVRRPPWATPGGTVPTATTGTPPVNGLAGLNLGPLGNSFENPDSSSLGGSIGGLNGLDISSPRDAIDAAVSSAARPNTTLSGGPGGLAPIIMQGLAGTGGSDGGEDPTATVGSNGQGLLGSIGDFIEKHPNAVAMGLQGLGSLATVGAERRLKSAQAQALESQAALEQNTLDQRKASQTALAPYWASLAAGGSTRAPAARNPYLPPTA